MWWYDHLLQESASSVFDLLQACKCPICRRLINLLVPAALSEQEDDPQAHRILGEIQHYNCIFGGAPRSLTQVGTLSMKSGVFTILSRINSTLEIGKSCCLWYCHAAIIVRVHEKTLAKLLDKQGPRQGFVLFQNRIHVLLLHWHVSPSSYRICIWLGNHLPKKLDYCTCALDMVILMDRTFSIWLLWSLAFFQTEPIIIFVIRSNSSLDLT